MRKDLSEVLVRVDRGSTTTKGKEALRQERAILLVLVKVIQAPWDMVAELPTALSALIGDAIERVEGSRYAGNGRLAATIVGRRDQSTVGPVNTLQGKVLELS